MHPSNNFFQQGCNIQNDQDGKTCFEGKNKSDVLVNRYCLSCLLLDMRQTYICPLQTKKRIELNVVKKMAV